MRLWEGLCKDFLVLAGTTYRVEPLFCFTAQKIKCSSESRKS